MYEQLGSLSATILRKNKSIADLYKEISLKNTTDFSSAEPPTPNPQTDRSFNKLLGVNPEWRWNADRWSGRRQYYETKQPTRVREIVMSMQLKSGNSKYDIEVT